MPEISLKAYFTKLDALLSAHAADEVIHHCRHILQYFPKNVNAYRLMGRALVNNGRWDEGREVLRRVLSVIPDDYAAHLGLSEANERMNRPDEAIWHLERALEQHSTERELLDALRGLYRRHRHVENLKIQLTSGAVARQNLRSGDYAKAVDTLRSASTRMTERLDLKLLLAQILWQQGSEEEAAEIALDVLKVLPDCLEANRIMAALWLSFDRPSDAQRYVNRLELVDPYLAVELVQGSAPDEDAFRIEELDYQRSSQSEMARARPDWLQEISSEAPAPVAVGSSGQADAQSSDSGGSTGDEEWSNWASAMLNSQATEAEAQVEESLEPPVEEFVAPANPPSTDEAVMTGGLTDLFGSPDDAEPEELAALFESGDSDDEGDPMAWLRGSSVEIVEDDELPDYDQLFGVDEPVTLPEPDANPMAWLGQSDDVDVDDEDDEDEDPFAWMREADAEPDDEDDLPAFQKVDSDALNFAYAESLYAETLTDDPNAELADEAEADQWAALDFGDDADDETVAPDTEAVAEVEDVEAPSPRRGLTAILQDANFDWVDRSPDEVVGDDEMDDWLNQFGGSSEPRADVTDVPDWLTQIDGDQDETADEVEVFAAEEEDADPADWLAQVEDDQSEIADVVEVSAEEAAVGDADWLTQVDLDEDAPIETVEAADDWDWSSSDQAWDDTDETTGERAAEPAPDDEAAWVNDEQLDEFAEPLAASGDAEDEAVAVNATAAAEADSEQVPGLVPEASKPEDVTGKMMSDNEFNWLNEPDSEPEADDQEELAADIPDWLSELDPTGAAADEPDDQADANAEAIPLEDEFGWLDDTNDVEEIAVSEMPDWMNGLAPEESDAEPEQEAETELEWTGDLSTADEEEAAVAGEVPDWLSELEPSEADAEPEPESEPADTEPQADTYEEEFAWLNETDADDADEMAAAEIPDWMSELAPNEAEPEAVTDEAGAEPAAELEWTGDLATVDEEEAAAVADEAPDWLSELEPSEADAEPVDEEEAAAVADEAPDWLSELEPSEADAEPEPEVSDAVSDLEFDLTDEEAAVADEAPDWLSELEPSEADAEPVDEEEAAAVADEAPDWLSELEPSEADAEPELADAVSELEFDVVDEEEAAAVADEAPDWLSELEPSELQSSAPEVSETEAEAEDGSEWAFTAAQPDDTADEEALAETYGWLNEPSAEVEEEAEAAAEEAPDWLAEDEAEPAPAEVDDFEWLNDGVSEAELADEDFESEIEAEPELEAVEAATEAAAFDDQGEFDDNQAEIETDADGEELEPEPAHNAPDWLNAMVPGLDVEYDVADDLSDDEADTAEEETEGEIAWLVDLVEEETAVVEQASFAFSRPPTWLGSTSPSAVSDATDDDFPDWPADDGDDDLPEWLR